MVAVLAVGEAGVAVQARDDTARPITVGVCFLGEIGEEKSDTKINRNIYPTDMWAPHVEATPVHS